MPVDLTTTATRSFWPHLCRRCGQPQMHLWMQKQVLRHWALLDKNYTECDLVVAIQMIQQAFYGQVIVLEQNDHLCFSMSLLLFLHGALCCSSNLLCHHFLVSSCPQEQEVHTEHINGWHIRRTALLKRTTSRNSSLSSARLKQIPQKNRYHLIQSIFQCFQWMPR